MHLLTILLLAATARAATRTEEVQKLLEADRFVAAKNKLKEALHDLTGAKPERAEVLSELGEVYLRWGRHNEALGAYEEATELLERLYGRADARVGVAADKLADTHVELKQFAEAVPIYQQLLDNMRRSPMGLSHPGEPPRLTLVHASSMLRSCSHLPCSHLLMLPCRPAHHTRQAWRGRAGRQEPQGGR
jgi:Tfp pilus assembly protein PilF